MVCFLSFPEFEFELRKELALRKIKIFAQHERLFICEPSEYKPLWAQDIWFNCKYVDFTSIKNAADILSAEAKRWCSYHGQNHSRAELIQQQVFRYKIPVLDFKQAQLPFHEWRAWSLLESNRLIMSQKTESRIPLGDIQFNQDKVNPPSRAYQKLWEVMTLHGVQVEQGQKCIDFGSSPGGWTWVLAEQKALVTSIDKAKIDEKLLSYPNVRFLKKDAFSLKPEELGPIDWFFSDIICYPPKLFELVQTWMDLNLCHRFVCSIKFQGETDYQTLKKFAGIPNSKLVHLCSNKHEVTWIKF